MAKQRNWIREEVWAALVLYLKTEFGRIHKGNSEIIALGEKINRTPSAVALKMSNLAALDQTLDRKGMDHASKMDKAVWQEWTADQNLILDFSQESLHFKKIEQRSKIPNDAYGFAEGQDRFVQSKQRVGQDIFRGMILSSYRSKCALTGIDEPKLLTASHIVGWAEDKKSRLDPSNGICLNALHDRAFDRHLISFDRDYRMLVSKNLPERARVKLEDVPSVELRMPDKFLPNQCYLERHRRHFFDAQLG
jgi:predicted restriction endonuclease